MRTVLVGAVSVAWLVLAACGGSGGGSCDNACTAGTTQCSGAQIQTCATDVNECTAWGTATSCAAGFSCSNNACEDICEGSAVKASCAQAFAVVVNACGGTWANWSRTPPPTTADAFCHVLVSGGQDPGTLCGELTAESAAQLHTAYYSSSTPLCCCPSGQACDYQNSTWSCSPTCSTGADCANQSGRTDCGPSTANLQSGGTAIFGPYICVPEDGLPGHACGLTQVCSGTAYHCESDSRDNSFCTTECAGDSACSNSGVACCNLDSSAACGLCGDP